MKRRTVLLGGAGFALAAGAGMFLSRPKDVGKNHSDYFSGLNTLLKRDGPGRPVMLLDIDRMDHNIDQIAKSVGSAKTFRIVVKSLPSMPLLQHAMAKAKTNALMVFHQPFLNAIVEVFPAADILLGKPMPVSAVETFYKKLKAGSFGAGSQVQWLVDTPDRLRQYQELAHRLDIKMRINCEIDVGLHRGGLDEPRELDSILDVIHADPDHLKFSGLMGYEPHLTGMKADLEHPAVQEVLKKYRSFVDVAISRGFDPSALTLNGAGSHTLGIYHNDDLMNDLSAGSGMLNQSILIPII